MIYCQSTTHDHSYNRLQINALLGQAVKLSRATLRNNNNCVISMFSELNANGGNAFESNWFYWNAKRPFRSILILYIYPCVYIYSLVSISSGACFWLVSTAVVIVKTPVSTDLLSSNVFYLREHYHQSMPLFAFLIDFLMQNLVLNMFYCVGVLY